MLLTLVISNVSALKDFTTLKHIYKIKKNVKILYQFQALGFTSWDLHLMFKALALGFRASGFVYWDACLGVSRIGF